MTNITNDFGTGNNFGALAIGGGSVSAETISAIGSVQNSSAKEVLEAAMTFINGADLNPGEKADGELLVREVASEPTKKKFQKLIGYMKSLGTGASAAGTLVGGIDGLIEKIKAIPF